jgi:hypothetical protein
MPDHDDEIRALQMENDLLSLEIEALRARLAGETDAEHPDAVLVDGERLRRLEAAQRDLKWLLERLGTGPIGFIVRRRRGYRRLIERHLTEE